MTANGWTGQNFHYSDQLSYTICFPYGLVVWESSNTEFFSTSTDSQVLRWDYRKLAEPIDQMWIDPSSRLTKHLYHAICAVFHTAYFLVRKTDHLQITVHWLIYRNLLMSDEFYTVWLVASTMSNTLHDSTTMSGKSCVVVYDVCSL